ncbi:MAG TPA: alpha/beta hydrolase [Acidimicrobiia bacterium]|nr:alpha/beta hydrolase [Acidimicrobiia bacterium]
MAAAPDPNAFATHRADVRNGVTIAYVREGVGGTPLLLLHGYPETKRIWWRNIGPLAAAGFEVIAPDYRGHGDSSLAPDNFYDIAAFAIDCYTLVHDVLGHESCAVAGGDVGGIVLFDIGLRYPGFVTRQVLFNTLPPPLYDVYQAAGLGPDDDRATRATADYFRRQSTEPDVLLAELDTPARRQAWVAPMYGHRLWGTPHAFTDEEVAFHSEPFADAAKLRASWGVYEQAAGQRPMEDVPKLFEPTPVPTMVLYGTEDHVVPKSFPWKAAAACLDCTGPLFVPNAGHFLQWESADTFNKITAAFCR